MPSSMPQSTQMSIDIVPLPHALGAEVRCADVRALDDASAAAIPQAFLDHLVLLFRGQKLDDHELMFIRPRARLRRNAFFAS